MSELDDARRRLLVQTLTGGGQAIVTTTNRLYFTDDELARRDADRARPRGPAARRRRRRRGCAETTTPATPAAVAGRRRGPRTTVAEFARLGDILRSAVDRVTTSDEGRAYQGVGPGRRRRSARRDDAAPLRPRRAHSGVRIVGVGERADLSGPHDHRAPPGRRPRHARTAAAFHRRQPRTALVASQEDFAVRRRSSCVVTRGRPGGRGQVPDTGARADPAEAVARPRAPAPDVPRGALWPDLPQDQRTSPPGPGARAQENADLRDVFPPLRASRRASNLVY